MRFLLLSAALMPLLAVSCSAGEEIACGGDGIVASDACVRATQPGQPMSAAYVSLCNGAAAADQLVAARFEGATATEIHSSSLSDDGVASMAPLADGLELPAGQSVSLAPGNVHIMLIGLTGALNDGDEPAITLEFANAPPVTLNFEVRSVEQAAEHSGH